ncbi:MAG: DUF4884 domain-containing protein [Bacteroidales bacterium]|nr:DUF4884 domain-containing protein [Bacteroidales bacterium]
MKKASYLLLLILSIISITSCAFGTYGNPVSMNIPDNNKTYEIYYLFEHNGCKVYRFYDRGNYVYFTDCTGSVTSITNDSTQTRTNTIVIGQ